MAMAIAMATAPPSILSFNVNRPHTSTRYLSAGNGDGDGAEQDAGSDPAEDGTPVKGTGPASTNASSVRHFWHTAIRLCKPPVLFYMGSFGHQVCSVIYPEQSDVLNSII